MKTLKFLLKKLLFVVPIMLAVGLFVIIATKKEFKTIFNLLKKAEKHVK